MEREVRYGMSGRVVERECTFTRAGQKLVQVLFDPEAKNWTAVERAKRANISLRRYYQLLADPDFQAALRAKALESLTPIMPAVLRAAQETAAAPGRDGFKDREMLLRMQGWYEPREAREISGPGGGPMVVAAARIADMSEAELAALAAGAAGGGMSTAGASPHGEPSSYRGSGAGAGAGPVIDVEAEPAPEPGGDGDEVSAEADAGAGE